MLKRTVWIAFSLVFLAFTGLAEEKSLLQRGANAYHNSNLAKALSFYEEAAKEYRNKQDTSKLLKAYFGQLEVKLMNPADPEIKPVINKLDSFITPQTAPYFQAKTTYYKLKTHVLKYEDDKALTELNRLLAREDYLKTEAPELLCRTYSTAIGLYKQKIQFDKAKTYIEKANESLDQHEIGNTDIPLTFYHWEASVYYVLNQPQKALKQLQKAQSLLKEDYSPDHIRYARNHQLMAKAFYFTLKPDSALHHTDKAMAVLEKHDAEYSLLAGNVYRVKAFIYLHQQKYYSALDYFQHAKDLLVSNLPKGHLQASTTYSSLATCYNHLNQPEKGLPYAKKALTNIHATPDKRRSHTQKQQIHQIFSSLYLKTGQKAKAQDHIQKAIKLGNQILPPGHINFAATYSRYFKVAKATGQLDTALLALRETKDILKAVKGPHAPKLVMYGYSNVAQIQRKKGNLSISLTKCQEGLSLVATNFNPRDSFANPKLSQLTDKQAAYYTGFEKVKTLYYLYKATDQKPYIKHAYQTMLLVDSINRAMKSDVVLRQNQSSWIRLANKFYPYSFRVMIARMAETENADLRNQILSKAYQFADHDKAAMLSGALAEKKMRQSNALPDSFFQKVQVLNQQIDQLKRKLSKVTNTEKRSVLQNQQLEKQQAKKALYQNLCETYPQQCHQIKSPAIEPLDTLQQALKRHRKNLVEFVGHGDHWFALTLTPDTLRIHPLPAKDSITDHIRAFRSSLKNREKGQLKAKAYQLHQKLFQPLAPALHSQEIVIVPDGILGYLPFSTLLKQQAQDKNFRQSPYLLKDYTFTYAPSASLWSYDKGRKNQKQSLTSQNFQGYARSFESGKALANSDNNRQNQYKGQLAPLPKAARETQFAKQWMNGTIYLNQRATEANFKQKATNAHVLHLATHGLLDDERPAFNKLLLAPDSANKEDGVLHTYELYNLDLNADLTVLSACNTGFGKLKEGEGVMSLARGFKVAGSANILMTLWNINDHASADLMKHFYKNLNQGMRKSAALRQAKLNYIENHDAINAHPFFWAGFVMMGSHTDITPQNPGTFPLYWTLGVLTLLAIVSTGIFWFWRK